MGGHQIRHKELFLSELFIEPVVFSDKFFINFFPRFPEVLQYPVRDVFRRHFQLTADVMFHQFFEKRVVRVRHQIVKADARADKYFFYAGQRPQSAKKRQIIRMIHLQIGTWFREKALSVFADALRHLFLAGRMSEIGGGTAHVVDIALEIRLLYHLLCFPQNGFVASDLHRPALMEGQRTEITPAETPSAADKREFDF